MGKSAKTILGLALAALVIFLAWWQSEKFREEARKMASGGENASETAATTTDGSASGQTDSDPTATSQTATDGSTTGETTSDQSEATEPGTETGATDQTETAPLSQSDTQPQPEPEPAEAPEPIAPEIDIVRVSPVGQAVVAGRASAGQVVEIVLDGEVLAELTADDTGQFATVLDLPSASEPQQLILRTIIDGEVAQSTSVQAEPDPIAVAKAEEARKAAEQAAAEEAAAKAASEEAARAAAEAKLAAEQAAAEAAAKAEAEEAERLAAEEAARKAEEEAARLAAEEAERKAAEEAARLAAEKAEAERLTAEAAADPAAGSVEPNVVASAPVFILPRPETSAAPVLVKPGAEDIALLQPAQVDPSANLTLDRLTYSDAGSLVAAGRGRPGSVVRVYANAQFLEEVGFNAAGEWQVSIEPDVASSTQLLRFDSIDTEGNVIGRLETPFEYSPESVAQELKEREIVVQRGDYLWKFAEQHYGQGWRYSVIFSANSDLIRDPDLIYPGQVFKVPELVQTQ